MKWLERTQLLLKEEKLEKLQRSNVLVVGLGGVGAYAAEMLCRAGIGKMTLVDGDTVEITNLNRQLPGTISNLGKPKTDVLSKRFLDINPEIELTIISKYITEDQMIDILNEDFDYVVDAIDTLSPKVALIHHSVQRGLNIVSSMGAGGKYDPMQIKIADISKSFNCNLARALRKRLYKLGVRKGFDVVFSSELVDENSVIEEHGTNKKSTVGTISYMPPAFGCFCASVVIRGLIEEK